MRWIEKQARYYQGYLADERSLIPVTILLADAVAIWLLAYLISSIGDPSQPQTSLSPHPSWRTWDESMRVVVERILAKLAIEIWQFAHAHSSSGRSHAAAL